MCMKVSVRIRCFGENFKGDMNLQHFTFLTKQNKYKEQTIAREGFPTSS